MSRTLAGVGIAIVLIGTSAWTAQEKQAGEKEKKDAKLKSVVGSVTDRGKDFIEVKADGEEKPRRYAPHFPGMPGGTDKATLEIMAKVPIGARVKLQWLYDERPRVMKIELVKTKEKDKNEDKSK